MNLPISLTSLALSFCALSTLATAQQPQPLPSDHYLVGTQGWVNNLIHNSLNTIQVISPYTGKATRLSVTGLPASEAPASFVIQNTASFLVGTKSLNTKTAKGNVYTVLLQTNNTWRATLLNTTPLNINVSDMVVSGNFAYVIGSSVFNNTGDDAQILRIALTTGTVSTHIQLGNKFFKTNKLNPGAMGLGSSLVIVGKDLHVFTFDTTNTTPQYNEHWRVSLSTPVTSRRLGSLPTSRRRLSGTPSTGHGFGTSGAFIDPKNKNRLVIVGRWGELVWRDMAGRNLKYEAFPGLVNFSNSSAMDELWRGVALNTNTHAFGLGDHNGASIDERRCANSTNAKEPFSNNIAKAIQPAVQGTNPTVIFTIAGMAYIPGKSSYRVITKGEGCPDRTNGIPCSYASGAPARGTKNFSLTLHARPQGASPTTVAMLLISSKAKIVKLGSVAPGCSLHVDLQSLAVIAPVGSLSNKVSIGPFTLPSQKLTAYTQWVLSAPKANAISLILSDARALILK